MKVYNRSCQHKLSIAFGSMCLMLETSFTVLQIASTQYTDEISSKLDSDFSPLFMRVTARMKFAQKVVTLHKCASLGNLYQTKRPIISTSRDGVPFTHVKTFQYNAWLFQIYFYIASITRKDSIPVER